MAGKKSEALKVLEQLKESEKNRFVSSIGLIYAYLGLGDQERAMEYLQESFEARDYPRLPGIRYEDVFDDLRSDPRFQEIIRRMNFPEK